MRPFASRPFLFALLGTLCAAQTIQPPEVVDRTLANGMKVLMVERPGSGAVRAELFIGAGRAATGDLAPAAADLLARTLFRRVLPATLDKELDLPLRQEGAAFETLRLERLRQARRPDRTPSPDLASLEAMHDAALGAIQTRLAPMDDWDDLDAMGGTQRTWTVVADYFAMGVDLPAPNLEAWCRLEAGQLSAPCLSRFPMERNRLLQELDRGDPPCAPSLAVLLATALGGRPYAQACAFHRADVEALTLDEVRTFGRRVLVPERLVLVLVGDVHPETLLPVLEGTFGKPWGRSSGRQEGGAAASADQSPSRDVDPANTLESPAGRRLLVSTTGETRAMLCWRVPPATHPDGLALRALGQILAGGASSRLIQGLVTTRGLASSLTLALGVPGDRDVNLLVLDAEPAQGHSLVELEQAIEGEVLRVQREPLAETEVRRAQVQMESQQIRAQEDAAVLARTLGSALCQWGDWRMAFRSLSMKQNLRPSDLQAAARTYLVPSRMTCARFGPDPLLLPLDRTEERLLQVLTALVQRRLNDPVQAQEVLREAIRQLRMLSPAERAQTLKLLEAQVAS